jgi:hypothetical protein
MTAAVILAALFTADALLGAVLGRTLRAIGRGFGNGTFALAQASAANADNPIASTMLVARAVDRKAVDRNAAGRS